jgi:serine phosphatase RsbU (regulator of sigma subunit)/anti-sigma regulatory factor (Ser/Thr protein kinase)
MSPRPKRGYPFSIRWIVTGLAVALTAAAVVSVSMVSERNARTALTAELQNRLLLEARALAQASAPALLNEFPELTLHPLVKEKLTRQPELSFAVVVDHDGAIQGDRDPQRLGTPWRPSVQLHPVAWTSLLGPDEELSEGPSELVARVPVVHASGQRIGEVVMGMRTSYLERSIAAARRQHAVVLVVFLVVGVAVSFVVVSQVLKPVAALRAGIERIAGGDLDTRIQVRGRTELGLLAEAMNEMSERLKRAQAEMVERERLSHELDLAREIQRSLLPEARLTVGAYALEGVHHAAAEVGGDYFDYFPLRNGTVGLAIADVSGKGLGGCLVMSMLSALLRSHRSETESPTRVLAALDDQLSATLRRGSFITMFYGILDPATGRLTYASAGHNPSLVYRSAARRIERIAGEGIPLGAVRGGAVRATLRDRSIVLEPGDLLLQYTDGVSEAFDPDEKEQFGFDRIADVLRGGAANGPHGVLERLHQAVEAWTAGVSPMDDETMLALYHDPRFAAAPRTAVVGEDPGTRGPAATDRYAEAAARGRGLRLAAHADILVALERWIAATPPLASLPRADAELLRTTLFEACANVAEHGYAGEQGRDIEVWWLPAEGTSVEVRDEAEASRALRAGEFLIRDEGAPFDGNDWRGKDFENAAVRTKGRGLGLEIIHRVMRPVRYNPATAHGNITIMKFGADT